MKILHWFNNLKVLRVDASQAATNEFLYKKARKELDVCRKILNKTDFNLIANRTLSRIAENEEIAATILDKSPSLFQGNNSNLIWMLEKNAEDYYVILKKIPSETLDIETKERIHRAFNYSNPLFFDHSIFSEIRQDLDLKHRNYLKEFYESTEFWWMAV